jgi:hypothetical protein
METPAPAATPSPAQLDQLSVPDGDRVVTNPWRPGGVLLAVEGAIAALAQAAVVAVGERH